MRPRPLTPIRSLNYTALHYASGNGHGQACGLLLKCGADVEAADVQ
jgi:ankyrin repeat protein